MKGDEKMGKKDEIIEEQEKKIASLEKDIETMTENFQKTTVSIQEARQNDLKAFQAKMKELVEHKPMMINTVTVTGVEDIEKVLDDSVKLLGDRLEKLGLGDKYLILAVPHTMSLGIVR